MGESRALWLKSCARYWEGFRKWLIVCQAFRTKGAKSISLADGENRFPLDNKEKDVGDDTMVWGKQKV